MSDERSEARNLVFGVTEKKRGEFKIFRVTVGDDLVVEFIPKRSKRVVVIKRPGLPNKVITLPRRFGEKKFTFRPLDSVNMFLYEHSRFKAYRVSIEAPLSLNIKRETLPIESEFKECAEEIAI